MNVIALIISTVALSSLLSLTGSVIPLLAQQENQTNATITASNTTQQQQNQTEATGVLEGQQQSGETPLTPNATVPSPEVGGGGAGRIEPLP